MTFKRAKNLYERAEILLYFRLVLWFLFQSLIDLFGILGGIVVFVQLLKGVSVILPFLPKAIFSFELFMYGLTMIITSKLFNYYFAPSSTSFSFIDFLTMKNTWIRAICVQNSCSYRLLRSLCNQQQYVEYFVFSLADQIWEYQYFRRWLPNRDKYIERILAATEALERQHLSNELLRAYLNSLNIPSSNIISK
ncbi:hypothetical protein B7486_47570 [cyanobacterium TDX16]|nr:hypothetical protein B7486_47570 [cyanobacterium TDX16]